MLGFPALFGVELLGWSYAAAHACEGPRQAVVLLPMAILGLLFAPVALLALIDLTLGDQGAGLLKISSDAFLGVLFWGSIRRRARARRSFV